MDVHSALAHLAFAVRQALEPLPVDVKIEWANGTYLAVKVECRGSDKQVVVDRLSHGVLQGSYDYRFSVSYPTGGSDTDWITVTAYPNLSHDDKRARK
ncbi:hypothetical protein EVB71_015 [Rhizobium phage RHph_Y55]|nr:hypothetical protein EVB71_015 [Rhizobium phage RHph_Y55]